MLLVFLNTILLAAGFVLLVKGADFFVDGTSSIAKKFGIPELIIGLTIVAMGTSAPEAAVSITGALSGSAEISVGNVVGSNIMNILVILGLASAIVPIAVERSTIRYEIPFMIAISVLFFLLGIDGNIGRIDGMVLWFAFILYFVYLFYMSKVQKDSEDEDIPDYPLWKASVFTALGLLFIICGSNFAIQGASELARYFGLSERLIGLTIVALGTSLPEMFTSVTAARRGNADIAIGNIVGSNIFNILFVLGTSALIIPVPFAAAFRVDAVIAILAAVLLWLLSVRYKNIGRIGGIIMLVGYVGYFVYLLIVR
ncbi:MAG: calcium/sodium antiporter [Lachnospiraceae bacterium]|nr:calcium/sodium antiporter [Lachnospiraceae bacterium]